jgi:riboflavin biosynthesis pyrimidine reductase
MRFSHPPTDEELLHLYAAPASPWARANMVSTLDGRASGPDGRSGSINSAADQQVFACLRALSAVVVVGAGTVRAEGYGRLRAPARFREHRASSWLPEHPVLAVVTASGNLPEHLLEPDPARGRLLVLTTSRVPTAQRERLAGSLGAGDEIVVCGEERVDPATAVTELRERGLGEVLTEGGPHLLRDWVAAGVVDELCLTVRPLLLGGDGRRILDGDGRDDGLPLANAETMLVLEVADDLMLRYRLRSP